MTFINWERKGNFKEQELGGISEAMINHRCLS